MNTTYPFKKKTCKMNTTYLFKKKTSKFLYKLHTQYFFYYAKKKKVSAGIKKSKLYAVTYGGSMTKTPVYKRKLHIKSALLKNGP